MTRVGKDEIATLDDSVDGWQKRKEQGNKGEQNGGA